MDIEKLNRHIDALRQVHDELDKQVREEFIKYGDDALVQSLKKKKLALKDEIESYRRDLRHTIENNELELYKKDMASMN